MPDPKTKLPENRMHLFDPVGLLNDGYGTYWSSNHAVRPRRPAKPCDACDDPTTNATQGLKSHEKSLSETNSRVGLLSSDALIHDADSFTIDDVNDLNVGEIRLQVKTTIDQQQDESDVSTPKLWKSNSPASPKSVTSSPSHPPASSDSVNSSLPLQPVSPRSSVVSSTLNGDYHNQYQTMSPSSRTQAIAKGRKELMEMVRDLPESFYELSLKDLVEKKPEMEIPKEVYMKHAEEKKEDKEIMKPKENKKEKKKSKKKVKKSESKKKMVRSRSVDNGRFFLRTLVVFPIFSRSKKAKRSVARSSSLKVAPMPKPQPTTTTNGSIKGVEKDWWRRRSCISSESDESNGLSSDSVSSETSSSSSRSNSSNRRRNRRFLSSCCFFNGTKVKAKK